MKHKHHIVPRHAGGTDDPSNLIELTVEEHAEAHRTLYEQHNRWQDYIAWKTLSGQMTLDESSIAAWKEGCRKGGSAPKPPLSQSARENLRRAKLGEKNPMYGVRWSEQKKDHMSRRMAGKNNPFYGKKHTNDMKRYISNKRIERHLNGSKEGNFGSHSDETKDKLRQANKVQFSDPIKKEKHRQAMIEWAKKRKER
jgi:NUMOD3 motif